VLHFCNLIIFKTNFCRRCHDVRELVQTFVQFEPLGRVEIGPVGLSTSISHIHVDFGRTLQAFQDDALLGYLTRLLPFNIPF
jgi:hypothetical protein